MVEFSPVDRNSNSHEEGIYDDEVTSTEILDILSRCSDRGAAFLDLSQRSLKCVPNEMLNIEHIQYLYLEGNAIESLPPNFFRHFQNLKWLDLRNNKLSHIPSAYLGNHTCLQTLLLGGNALRCLPLELGVLSTLNSLNIADNPIEFPPQHVLDGGVQTIITFLRRMLLAKSGRKPTAELSRMNGDPDSSSSYVESAASRMENGSVPTNGRTSVTDEASVMRLARALSNQDLSTQPQTDLGDSVNSHSATLHKPIAYYQIRQQYLERVRKGSSQSPLVSMQFSQNNGSSQCHWSIRRPRLKKQSDKHNKFVNKYPEPPPMDAIERRMLEEKRKQRMKDVKQKEDAILQRRRDQESVKQWREESRTKQRAKYLQQMRKERTQIKAESNARLDAGPYDTDSNQYRMKSKDEWQDDQWRNIQAEEKPRPLSPTTLEVREVERVHRERELQARVKDHTKNILEKRRRTSAKATAQEEIEAARRDMQILQMMRRTLSSAKGRIEFWN